MRKTTRSRRIPGPTTQILAGALVAAIFGATGTATAVARETGSVVTEPACDARGLEPLLTRGRILLLGEIHGSREGPSLVAEAVCSAASRALPVVVALEIPLEEKDRIDAFLGADGSETDHEALLGGDFWQRDYQDGRSSLAMLRLLDSLRALRRQGREVSVVLLDRAARFASGQQRDAFLAARLTAAVEAAGTNALILALTGNVHSRSTPGVPWDGAYRPAGLSIDERWPDRTLSILLTNPPGEAWTCPDADPAGCGAHAMGGASDGVAGRVELYPQPEGGHDGDYRLEELTASPPAAHGDSSRSSPSHSPSSPR